MAEDSETTCGYCLRRNENLEESRTLPCGHIHCLTCLSGALEVHGVIECADCKWVDLYICDWCYGIF